MLIDLRSDTVTKPTPEMKEAMFSAPVGDDVFGEDPTINQLEKMAAEMFGKEAAIFAPSGTMTNQIAIKIHTSAPGEVICDELSHIYKYEGGGIGFNSGLSVRLLKGDRGRLTANQIEENINPDDVHLPPTQLISLENTCNKGAGSIYELNDMQAIAQVAKKHNLPLHLDGARIFNAIIEKDYSANDIGQLFDTISVCLSKGLGCPVGSVLVGDEKNIKKARRIRKILGGGMRQAGILAAAGIYALENNISRLKDDHNRAKAIGEALKNASFVKDIMPIETNIVVFYVQDNTTPEAILEKLKEKNILAVKFGPQMIRMVTHLDFDDKQLDHLCKTIKNM
ncbi:MAG TPA: low-specificity L-threonine aldolase [Flavobacteriales bacterium]|nr:low-specificity L-threonine aldolase [Flavobacteriales bacterium]